MLLNIRLNLKGGKMLEQVIKRYKKRKGRTRQGVEENSPLVYPQEKGNHICVATHCTVLSEAIKAVGVDQLG